MSEIANIVEASQRLDNWIEFQEFCGWDPFDALNSPLLKRLTFGSRRLGQVWVQFFKHSPINLRPLLGVSKGYNPKGMGLFLASYLRKYQQSGETRYQERILFFADWLQQNVSPGYNGACWGYNFDWPNRGFFAPKGTPTVVNTAFIGLAFLDLYQFAHDGLSASGFQLSGLQPSVFRSSLDIARSACQFIIHDLQVARPASDECCFSYTPLDHRCVHNANVLGAWLLAEVGAISSDSELAQFALQAARYTARRQLPDGSWPYGENGNDTWVDNFHTGYVLVAMNRIGNRLQTDEFNGVVKKGYQFWKREMFLPDGTPKFYANKTYPIDTHCAAQSILTFLEFTTHDPQGLEWAERVAGWAVEHLQNAQGYFNYQRTRYFLNRSAYMRWTQAWMQRALTELLFLCSRHDL